MENNIKSIIQNTIQIIDSNPQDDDLWLSIRDSLDNSEVLHELQKNTDCDLQYALKGIDEFDTRDMFYNVMQNYLHDEKTIMYGEGGQFETNDKEIEIFIGDKKFELLVAKTDQEKKDGLMDVVEMDDDEGMMFDYRNDPKSELSYWMKDTQIPLDIVFIDNYGKVMSVKQGSPNSTEPIIENNTTQNRLISFVVEVNINSGIKVGDICELNDDLGTFEFDEDTHPELSTNKLYVIGSDGTPQAELEGGERIFSRKSTKTIINKAKRAFVSKLDKDYKSLAKYVIDELKAQDSRKPEFVKEKGSS